MILLQLFVIVIAILIVFTTISHRSSHSGRAWKKVALIALAVSMVISVLIPNIFDDLAHLMGVGRGTDLLLYLTVVAFILYVLNSYLHQQDQRDKLYSLARKISILEANDRYKDTIGKSRK